MKPSPASKAMGLWLTLFHLHTTFPLPNHIVLKETPDIHRYCDGWWNLIELLVVTLTGADSLVPGNTAWFWEVP